MPEFQAQETRLAHVPVEHTARIELELIAQRIATEVAGFAADPPGPLRVDIPLLEETAGYVVVVGVPTIDRPKQEADIPDLLDLAELVGHASRRDIEIVRKAPLRPADTEAMVGVSRVGCS